MVHITKLVRHFPSAWILLLFFLILLSSCRQESQTRDKAITDQFKIADQLAAAENRDSSIRLLTKLRPSINQSDSSICTYYCLLTEIYEEADKVNLYADSAMAFFKDEKRKTEFPNLYYKALLSKGYGYFKKRQYNLALKYFYNAKKVIKIGDCEDGYISNKMASIYYSQKNYSLAAMCWAKSARLLNGCYDKMSAQKRFFTKQAVLNNSGVAYEKAGKLDSAEYYYMQDVKLINYTDTTDHRINTNNSKFIVYDNLGGLNLKKGNIPAALSYLNKCLALPVIEKDGMQIPPHLKLAELYLKTAQYTKASAALDIAKQKLDKYGDKNPNLVILWHSLYSQYLFKLGQTAKAYEYQNTYMRLRDSLDKIWADVYKLDVNRELNLLYQQQTLTELKHKNKDKKIFIYGIVVIALMSFVIIVLIYRNLKKSQKLQKSTIAQNQQLQQTLAELERVNQNYIRIMRVMAHDLRNPLSGMTGLAAMLLGEDEFNEENRHMLQLIESTGIHTMEMISELLKSGLDDENQPVEVTMLDLRSLLYDSVELLRFKAAEKEQQIIFESSEEPIMAPVNHEKIWRVFNNLIVNAIKFSHEKSIIKVSIQHQADHVLVSVADSGIGIAGKDKESVFEMFTSAKRVGTGGEQPFGLGLSISKRIVEKHRGKIWFESEPGVGTTFFIELPCAV
jgi:signal transduction histidine kinase